MRSALETDGCSTTSSLRTAEAMDEAAAALERTGRFGDQKDVRGMVRIAAPSGLAVHVLALALLRLRERAPNLDVVLQQSVSSADPRTAKPTSPSGCTGLLPASWWFDAQARWEAPAILNSD